VQIRRNQLKLSRIQHIFISHLHGDHYFGLPGLLSSLHLLGYTHEVHLYAPAPLEELLHLQFKHSDTHLKFPLVFHAIDAKSETCLFEDHKVKVTAVPLQHRIACTGFLFEEKPGGLPVRKEWVNALGISPKDVLTIKAGSDYVAEDGTLYRNEQLTHPAKSPIRYAYCSDTRFFPELAERVRGVDLLYHEATFCQDLAHRARDTYHSTAAEAAEVAKLAGAKRLLIGHFSARYKELDGFLRESREIFPETDLAEEGKTWVL
jgi:ribonuclease Z